MALCYRLSISRIANLTRAVRYSSTLQEFNQEKRNIRVTRTSPIRLSPIGLSPLVKIQRYIGETPLHFRQSAKLQKSYWQKYNGLPPVVMDQF
jgi:hypothetical protein